VEIIELVDIAARVAASNATHAETERSHNKTMVYAVSVVGESRRPVSITALRAVTVMHPVNRAKSDVKYVAVTLGAARLVTSLVILVHRQLVRQVVLTPGARLLVQLLAIRSLAL
jgi:hypothetical protein